MNVLWRHLRLEIKICIFNLQLWNRWLILHAILEIQQCMLHGMHMMLRPPTKRSKVSDSIICSCSVEFCVFLKVSWLLDLNQKRGVLMQRPGWVQAVFHRNSNWCIFCISVFTKIKKKNTGKPQNCLSFKHSCKIDQSGRLSALIHFSLWQFYGLWEMYYVCWIPRDLKTTFQLLLYSLKSIWIWKTLFLLNWEA